MILPSLLPFLKSGAFCENIPKGGKGNEEQLRRHLTDSLRDLIICVFTCSDWLAGGPQVRFSIGAGDRQALQPPLCSTLPVTHTDVALFFQHLGQLRFDLCPHSMSLPTFCFAFLQVFPTP